MSKECTDEKPRTTYNWAFSAGVPRLELGPAPLRPYIEPVEATLRFETPEDLERFITKANSMLHVARGGSCGCEPFQEDDG